MSEIENIFTSELPDLIIEERENTNVVIGVPHHAPAGVSELPCSSHTTSDENTGYLGKYIADKLDCCYIIACNYSIDVNKCLGTDYSIKLLKWAPKLFVEIHGHHRKRTRNDVEISCGSL